MEIADLYKVSKLKVIARGGESAETTPPWHGAPPRLDVYRERGHRRLSLHVPPLADRFQPAVLHMLRETIQAGRHTRIGVCLCGELAADPIATSVLIGIGLEEFSVSPQLIPELSKQLPAGRCRKPKQSRAKR